MDILSMIVSRVVSFAVGHATEEFWRAASAWWSLDDQMPRVNRAFGIVRNELSEVGLLEDGVYLDQVDLIVSPIPSHGEAGYVYEGESWLTWLFRYQPGNIYLPSDLPQQAYVPGGTLTDTIRHEFGHAWHYLDPGVFERPWFRRTFALGYDETDIRPEDVWQDRLQRDRSFRKRLEGCRNERERNSQIRRMLHNDFVSGYAATLAREDFAETFMFYLRYRNCLDRFQCRTGVYKKLKAVEHCVSVSRRKNGL